ncbi:MAG: glycosyltransferase family 39 protein [Patescibacteria group bacterium]
MPKNFEKIILFLLLAIFAGLNLYLAATDSQTIDEGPHISAGYSYWLTGNYLLNPEHPPLVKLFAALPLLFFRPQLSIDYPSLAENNEWSFGRAFIYHNNINADIIIFTARIFPIILGLILGYFIYKWAKELWGTKGGLLALFLYALSPNFLGHSHLVTTDVPLTLFFLLSIYYFGQYLKNPSRLRLITAAVMFSFAMLTKYSAFILIPILVSLYFVNWLIGRQNSRQGFKKFIKVFLVFFGVTSVLIFVFYRFEFKKPIDDPRVQKLYQQRTEIIANDQENNQLPLNHFLLGIGDPEKPIGKFLYRFANVVPVPAYTYWQGLFSVLSHNANGHGAYLLGEARNFGWWYYFIIAFLVKTPTVTIILFFSSIIYVIYRIIKNIKTFQSLGTRLKSIPFDYYLIALPPFIYFAWSLTSHLNLGVRHIFPIYPLVFIVAASFIKLTAWSPRLKYLGRYTLYALLLFYLIGNILSFPSYLAYFNGLIGGSNQGYKYLSDSNLDWGQDIKRLKIYLEENKIKEFHSLLFGSLEANYYIKGEITMPDNQAVEKSAPQKGYYVISATVLFDPTRNYTWMQNYHPIKIIGHSIYIYKF